MTYLILFFALLSIYIVGILLSKRLASRKALVNSVFVVLIVAFYLYIVRYTYLDVGPDDWNFKNTLPTANVSPFMFTTTLVMWLLPKSVRKHLFTLVSLLSFGMLVAGLGGCLDYVMRDYMFHWHIAFDCAAHVLLSLWGAYLIRSEQVELTPQKAIRGGAIIVSVAALMLILNSIFKTAFFGLSVYGDHNIYNIKIFESGVVSILVYFVGLCLVLCLGYCYQKILNMKRNHSK